MTDLMLTEPAPAKINLYLHVTGRRADGYHLLDSLVVFADAADLITAQAAAALSLRVGGPMAAALAPEMDPAMPADAPAHTPGTNTPAPGGGDNLVLRAARALAAHLGRPAAAALHLHKVLPVASGIGGGSADAAASLRVLCRLWGVEVAAADLHAIALRLGADVPVCLASRPARMGGVGEVLLPAPALPRFGLVLANPGVAVPTPAVFAARSGGFTPAPSLPACFAGAAALAAFLATCRNDLQAPALQIAPVIGAVLQALAALPGARLSRMSGSGATCFALFDDEAQATAAAAVLRESARGWWVWGGGLFTP